MKLLIFDFDGTLTESSWRKHYHERKEYSEYHKAVVGDKPNLATMEVFESAIDDENFFVVISTARPEKDLQSLFEWITERTGRRYFCPVFFRHNSDSSRSYEIKRKNLELILTMFPAAEAFAFDDDINCIKMYEDAGIPTTAIENN